MRAACIGVRGADLGFVLCTHAHDCLGRSMQRVLAPVLENVAALNPGEAHRAPETSTDQHGEPVSESLRPVQSDPGKVPKWLKLPGKK
ncbi:hypothetical protein FKM82_027508 [Ascaphus truei]